MQHPDKARIPLVFGLVAGLATIGCHHGSGAEDAFELEDEGTVATQLEADDGGFTMDDEAPLFGEADLFAELDDEVPYADPYEDGSAARLDPESTGTVPTGDGVDSLMNDPDAAIFHTVVLWGQIPGDLGITDPTDWTGTWSINRGGMIVRSTIAFDAHDEVLPRDDRAVVGFESRTMKHFDGLRLTLIDPTPAADAPLTLRYQGPDGYTLDLVVADLLGGAVSTPVDDLGNQISAVAIAQPVDLCNFGTMRGHWRAIAAHRGIFRGHVRGAAGEVRGHVRGLWGQRQSGEKVFFGKYINVDGQFRGLLAGHYQDGRFRGRWLTRAGEVGVLGGRYRTSGAAPAAGHFIGRWAERSCDVQVGPAGPVDGEDTP